MDRYKISNEGVKKSVKFLKTGAGTPPKWVSKYKDDLTVKGSKLFYKDREVVGKERVDEVLRKELYKKKGDVPSGRDSAFHILKQRYVGISRRALMSFIRAQKPLGEVKAALPKPKMSAGERLKHYVFETDLVFLKKNDLEKANKLFIRKELPDLSYFLTVTEKITGLTRFAYVLNKTAEVVTPIVIKLAKEMCKSLKTTAAKCEMRMDKGGEFSVAELSKHFKKAVNVQTGVSVENKNAQFQKCFFQILRQRKATSIVDAMEQSETLLNNTFNKIHKRTSNELVTRGDEEENIKVYNAKRKAFVPGDKRKQFAVGTHVRLLVKSKKPGISYKRYKNMTFSQQVYVITKVTKKAKPTKYRVAGKWWLQSDLLKSAPRDEASNKLMADRDEEYKENELKERQDHVDQRLKQIDEEEKMKKRPKRKAATDAKLGMVHDKMMLAHADDLLDEAEDEDEKQEVVRQKKELLESKKKLANKVKKKAVVEEKKAVVEKKKVVVEKKKAVAEKKKTVAEKKKAFENAQHKKFIAYARKHGIPSGGDLYILKQRIIQYKKQKKKAKAKAAKK